MLMALSELSDQPVKQHRLTSFSTSRRISSPLSLKPQAATIPARANGSRRTFGPPSFAMAFATAGASGGTPGSPTPVGATVLGTM